MAPPLRVNRPFPAFPGEIFEVKFDARRDHRRASRGNARVIHQQYGEDRQMVTR